MKKLFFGMLVAVVATGGSLMSYASNLVNHSKGKADATWFRYHGVDPTDPANYTATTEVPEGCGTGSNLCAILAEPSATNSNRPNLLTQSDFANKLNP